MRQSNNKKQKIRIFIQDRRKIVKKKSDDNKENNKLAIGLCLGLSFGLLLPGCCHSSFFPASSCP